MAGPLGGGLSSFNAVRQFLEPAKTKGLGFRACAVLGLTRYLQTLAGRGDDSDGTRGTAPPIGSPAGAAGHGDDSGEGDETGEEWDEEGGPWPGHDEDLFVQHSLTDDELDSLVVMKNFEGIQGLPPLEDILDADPEGEERAMRRELERLKQAEMQSSRVRVVDGLGRAYATGKRKMSVARVWLFEGEGRISINGKAYDGYFPEIPHRTMLLQPFMQTSTLGMFDVKSTVAGGGKSGQAGAMRHGISKALQLFEPSYRPALKSEGFLTRDSRVVERKKPGKAKARKSFQWVKR